MLQEFHGTREFLAKQSKISGQEIPFAGCVPLSPNVRPAIFLAGSDFDMGYQYVHQIAEIFGMWIFDPWILSRNSGGASYSQREIDAIHTNEQYLRKYTPD